MTNNSKLKSLDNNLYRVYSRNGPFYLHIWGTMYFCLYAFL